MELRIAEVPDVDHDCPHSAFPETPPPGLLSAESLASLLQVSVRTVWRLRSSGRLPRPVRIGGSIRWRAEDVRQWIAQGCPVIRG